MTQFGATDLLTALMAHYPKEYFPGMQTELKTNLLASFEKHFEKFEDEVVLEALDEWIEQKSAAPAVSDLLRLLSGKGPTRTQWCHVMSQDEINGLKELCMNGWTEVKDGHEVHYKGPGITCAYCDYTIDGSRDRIAMPFEKFFNMIKQFIKAGYLV